MASSVGQMSPAAASIGLYRTPWSLGSSSPLLRFADEYSDYSSARCEAARSACGVIEADPGHVGRIRLSMRLLCALAFVVSTLPPSLSLSLALSLSVFLSLSRSLPHLPLFYLSEPLSSCGSRSWPRLSPCVVAAGSRASAGAAGRRSAAPGRQDGVSACAACCHQRLPEMLATGSKLREVARS